MAVRADDAASTRHRWKIRREATENSQIMKTLHVLTDVYGPRLTGSPNLKSAGEWAIKQMESWGFANGRLEPWDFGNPGWLNQRFTAHLVSPVTDALVGEVLAWTPSTRGPVRAAVVNLILPERPSQDEISVVLCGQRRGREGQDGAHRPASDRAGRHQPGEQAARRRRGAVALRSGQPGAVAVCQPHAAHADARPPHRRRSWPSSSTSSSSIAAPSRGSTTPAASTGRFAPSTTARSTSPGPCPRWSCATRTSVASAAWSPTTVRSRSSSTSSTRRTPRARPPTTRWPRSPGRTRRRKW